MAAPHHARRARSVARGVIRAVVLALAFAVSASSATTSTVWAALLGIEAPHVCHCSRDHHDCVCARCDTDPDAATRISKDTLQSRCGDDDVVFAARRLLALPMALALPVVTAAPAPARIAIRPPSTNARSRDPAAPPTPPPRSES